MKIGFLLLAALLIGTPSLADSGEVADNFEEAILGESADDQGVNPFSDKPMKKDKGPVINPFTGKPVKKFDPYAVNPFEKKAQQDKQTDSTKDLPEGFEEAILGESADDQNLQADFRKGRPIQKSAESLNNHRKKKDVKDLIADFIKYNETHGIETPSSEDECVDASSSKVELSICLEMLGHRSSVVSARNANRKKTPGHYGSENHDKASINFTAE